MSKSTCKDEKDVVRMLWVWNFSYGKSSFIYIMFITRRDDVGGQAEK
jgi:hypothetical protein